MTSKKNYKQKGRNYSRSKTCQHKRRKKNWPFGRKSKPRVVCKDCRKLIKPHDLMELRKGGKRGRV